VSGASVTGARSELGRLLAPHRSPGTLHINVAGQRANTLLHDEHAWQGFARIALSGVRKPAQEDRS
jgi:hypothetical protein